MRPKDRAFWEEAGSPVAKNLIAALLGLVLIAPLPSIADQTPAEPTPAAMNFAAGFAADHLSGMLSRIGARQPAMIALGQANGAALEAIFNLKIDAAVAKYSDQWQRNMALAWTPLMTEEELTSLTTAGAQSPHTDKYLSLRGQAGQTMGALSQDLFRQILTEVLSETIQAVTPETSGQTE